jgi:hypothetical protein
VRLQSRDERERAKMPQGCAVIPQGCGKWNASAAAAWPTILLDLFLTNQQRKRMIEAALADCRAAGRGLPGLRARRGRRTVDTDRSCRRLEMPLSTMLFRLGRLERRGHAERFPNPTTGGRT